MQCIIPRHCPVAQYVPRSPPQPVQLAELVASVTAPVQSVEKEYYFFNCFCTMINLKYFYLKTACVTYWFVTGALGILQVIMLIITCPLVLTAYYMCIAQLNLRPMTNCFQVITELIYWLSAGSFGIFCNSASNVKYSCLCLQPAYSTVALRPCTQSLICYINFVVFTLRWSSIMYSWDC